MASVSGVIAWDNIQVDGRHIVREIWNDDLGNEYIYDYMADIGMDVPAKMNSRTDQVLADATAYQLDQAGG